MGEMITSWKLRSGTVLANLTLRVGGLGYDDWPLPLTSAFAMVPATRGIPGFKSAEEGRWGTVRSKTKGL